MPKTVTTPHGPLLPIHDAMTARLRIATASTEKLAIAMRDVCKDLNADEVLDVGGYTLKWVIGECKVENRQHNKYPQPCTKRILLLDDALLVEPDDVVTWVDNGGHNGFQSIELRGPVDDDWWLASTMVQHRVAEKAAGYTLREPATLRLATRADLREAARALPAAMSLRQLQLQAELESEAADAAGLTATLRARPEAMLAKLLQRVRMAVEDWGAKSELARKTGIDATALSRYLSGARRPTTLDVLALQGWLDDRQQQAGTSR